MGSRVGTETVALAASLWINKQARAPANNRHQLLHSPPVKTILSLYDGDVCLQ